MTILIGAVKPWVFAAFKEIQAKYPCNSVYGNPSTGKPDHIAGLALDFMVMTDRAKGDAISSYAIANYKRLGIGYVIWYQRIWYPSRGWSAMADRGSDNANHKNHVHLNFQATAPTGGGAVVNVSDSSNPLDPLNPFKGITDSLGKIGDIVSWVTDPHNLGRVSIFLLGAGMVLIAIGKALGASQVVKPIAKAVSSNVAKS